MKRFGLQQASAMLMGGALFAVLAGTGSCPPCPAGQTCGNGPEPTPQQTCKYFMTCFYDPAAHRVFVKGNVNTAKDPFPPIHVAISAKPGHCFSFSGDLQPSLPDAASFGTSVPLNTSQAHALYPDASILADSPDGTCNNPGTVSASIATAGDNSLCRCQVSWPQ
jgi:hypothetical protein